jgi:hypothetical protein
MRMLTGGFFSVMLLIVIGCSTMNMPGISTCGGTTPCGWISPQGKLVAEDTSSTNIELGQMDEDANYYYSDTDSLPTALVKLSKEYTIDDARWQLITDPHMLAAFIQYLKRTGGMDGTMDLRSFAVKGYDARPIGTWYSNHYVYGMRLNMLADNRVALSVPNFRNTRNFFVHKKGDTILTEGMQSAPAIRNAFRISTEISQATVSP